MTGGHYQSPGPDLPPWLMDVVIVFSLGIILYSLISMGMHAGKVDQQAPTGTHLHP